MKNLKTRVIMLTLLTGMLSIIKAFPYDFCVDGLYYLINSADNSTVSVTYGETSSGSYSGIVEIPEMVSFEGTTYNVTSISPSAFYNCIELYSLHIPTSISKIGSNAFYGCNSMCALYIDSFESWCNIEGLENSASNPLYFAHNLYINNELAKNIILPDVETLPSGILWGCESVENVEIRNTTKYIKDSFQGCINIEKINIPNSVVEIKGNAFRGCTSLSYVIIEDGESSLALNSHTILNTISYVFTYNGLFSDCKINELYIGRNIYDKNWVWSSMFDYYDIDREWNIHSSSQYLNTITFGPEVTKINGLATLGCKNLKNVIFETPSKVCELDGYAFVNCKGLKKLHLPESVTRIGSINHEDYGYGTFASTDSLTELYIEAPTPPQVRRFNANILESCTLYVPNGSKDLYETTFPWNEFVNIVEIGNDPSIIPSAGSIYVNAQEIRQGKTVLIPILMDNEDEIVSLQCDIIVPNSVTVSKNGSDYDLPLGERCSGYSISSSDYNGAIRVVCLSPTNTPINGNEGAIFYLPIIVPNELPVGIELPITIKNTLMTKAENFVEIVGEDFTTTLTVIKGFTAGDINDDGRYTISDVSMCVEYILGRVPTNSIAEAADVNSDGKVSISDVSIIVSYVLQGITPAPKRVDMSNMSYNTSENLLDVGIGKDSSISIACDRAYKYTAMQFDLTLPEGVSIESIRLAEGMESHSISYHKLNNNTLRVVTYSTTNANMSGGNLVYISAHGLSNGTIGIDNVIFTEKIGAEIIDYASTPAIYDLKVDGLTSLSTNSNFSIKRDGHSLLVQSPVTRDITITDTLGRTRTHRISSGINQIDLYPGIYFIDNYKVIIK